MERLRHSSLLAQWASTVRHSISANNLIINVGLFTIITVIKARRLTQEIIFYNKGQLDLFSLL
jgi:hypothetical protein